MPEGVAGELTDAHWPCDRRNGGVLQVTLDHGPQAVEFLLAGRVGLGTISGD